MFFCRQTNAIVNIFDIILRKQIAYSTSKLIIDYQLVDFFIVWQIKSVFVFKKQDYVVFNRNNVWNDRIFIFFSVSIIRVQYSASTTLRKIKANDMPTLILQVL